MPLAAASSKEFQTAAGPPDGPECAEGTAAGCVMPTLHSPSVEPAGK
eukprot:CAMPEP_0172839854 /NCGR_PEP_ID=MMETSP1075-20121228/28871_1 /TAXON_ID=2916 /ORGANISM="Ceratium fusus, Strain PA161109" /LENGTH=46 /DNA_ID= /DNA_START= /DNA_END= /DNA_ORIENTATION=